MNIAIYGLGQRKVVPIQKGSRRFFIVDQCLRIDGASSHEMGSGRSQISLRCDDVFHVGGNWVGF